jgi:phage terminase large subunit-like protein
MARDRKIVTIHDALKELGSNLSKLSYAPNMHSYEPHIKQKKFHSSPKKRRLYIGGNRSGKTVGGIMEDIWWSTGKHPFLNLPQRPMEGRIVTVDFTYGLNQIIIPKLKQWIPPSELRGGSWFTAYDAGLRVLNFENGSTIELMSYEQDMEKFAGVPRDWTHFDEEPPKPIYDECQARLIDRAGRSWITMTPLDGMTWVYDLLYEPGITGNPGVDVIQVDMAENPYIDPESRDEYLSNLDEDDIAARKEGNFVQLGGLVYKIFKPEIHVIDPVDPVEFSGQNYKHYMSLDHGFNNPTAVLWHAADVDNRVYTFDEHYVAGMTIDFHAKIIKQKELEHKRNPDMRICDPALAQRQGVTGTSIQTEYAIRGVGMVLGNNDVITGVAKVNQYLAIQADGKPSWRITRNCANLIKEIARLRWKTWASKKQAADNNPYDQIHKKDDHACDSARYFFSFMPSLRQTVPPPVVRQVPSGFGGVPRNPNTGFIDSNLTPSALAGNKETQWQIRLNED